MLKEMPPNISKVVIMQGFLISLTKVETEVQRPDITCPVSELLSEKS
jgi:hypothetical protein